MADVAPVIQKPAGLGMAYGALATMLVVPQFIFIHPYLHLLIMAPLLVWIGSMAALIESQKAPGESQVETVSKKDAMQFPLFGSAMLFGLYIVVKLVSKEYINALLSCYFALMGSVGLFGFASEPVNEALGTQSMARFTRSIQWKLWKKEKSDDDALHLDFNAVDVLVFVCSTAVSVSYAITKTWWLNNMLGVAFSIEGIKMITLGSYVIGCMLLAGLFFYDIFWVFGTEVMVAVAKGINAPIKILFPKALGVKPVPCSMLGLGDIVVPGIFIAMMLRFDAHQRLSSQPYFYAQLVAYTLGLFATVAIMHLFDSAQPALLYLVPACIGASLAVALCRGELKQMITYSVEKPKEAAGEEPKKEQ